jgi:chemotaxis signal transduction protein
VDLSVLLGGDAEQRPGLAVVVDVSPTIAVRVKQGVEVTDVAQAPFLQLPKGLGELLPSLVRGTLVHQGKLYLELIPEALRRDARPHGAAPLFTPAPLSQAPERALLFQSQGQAFGVPLAWVQQIVTTPEAFCPLPRLWDSGISGLLAHGQALWPVYSIPGLLGAERTAERLFVLAEVDGNHLAMCAEQVLGVRSGLVPGPGQGLFADSSGLAPSLFLDFQRIFS